MKRFLLSILSVCLCAALSGQAPNSDSTRPTFRGQDVKHFTEWVYERLVFDPEARAEGIGGRVTLTFTVEPDGTVDKVKLLRGLDPRLDEEAMRVVSSSPRWEWHTDSPKPFTYTFSVVFKNDLPCPYPFDEFEYAGRRKPEKLRIYSVSHGSIVLDFPFHTIFIDPVMKMGERTFTYGWFKSGAKTVLLTHEHGDHLDRGAVDYLTEGPSRPANGIYGNGGSIEALGRGDVLRNGDTLSVDNGRIHIKAVPAYNTTKGHLKFHPKGNGNGYLIEAGGLVIYVAGDTEVIPEMKKLGKVDIAIIPVNQPYTMTPEQCIKAVKSIKPKVLIPYHMGGTDMSPVLEAFENSGVQVIFHEELR